MRKPGVFLLIVIAAVACGIALWVVHPRQSSLPAPGPPVSTEPANPQALSQSPIEPQETQSSASSEPNESTTSGTFAASPSDAVPAKAAAASPEASPEKPGELFLSDDEIAAAIRDKGGVAPVYLAASTSHREDIIDYLMSQDKLRDALPTLLPLENDSSLRAYMLERTIPKGYFDEAAPPSASGPGSQIEPATEESTAPPVDKDLEDLLDSPTSTPMNPEEWIARMDLALQTADAFGLQWARKARDEGPSDPGVQALASTTILNLAQSDPSVTADERSRAEQTLFDTLGAGSVDPDQRIRAYYALYFAPDRNQARDFLDQRRSVETDPRARRTIEQLLQRWGNQEGNPTPPPGGGG